MERLLQKVGEEILPGVRLLSNYLLNIFNYILVVSLVYMVVILLNLAT